MSAPQTFAASEIHAAIERIVTAIRARHGRRPDVCLVGIATGGLALNRRLHAALGGNLPYGQLDTTFHRDDIGRNPIPKARPPTILPFDVTGRTVILVDDVLHTGRTINAALNELFDHGRPSKVELAVLVDRGGHMLPIAADYTGLTIAPDADEKVITHFDPDTPDSDSIEVVRTQSKIGKQKSNLR